MLSKGRNDPFWVWCTAVIPALGRRQGDCEFEDSLCLIVSSRLCWPSDHNLWTRRKGRRKERTGDMGKEEERLVFS